MLPPPKPWNASLPAMSNHQSATLKRDNFQDLLCWGCDACISCFFTIFEAKRKRFSQKKTLKSIMLLLEISCTATLSLQSLLYILLYPKQHQVAFTFPHSSLCICCQDLNMKCTILSSIFGRAASAELLIGITLLALLWLFFLQRYPPHTKSFQSTSAWP